MSLWCCLSLLVVVGGAFATNYTLETTIPWGSVALRVDVSVTYNGYYYLTDRTNSAVQVLDISTLTMLPIIPVSLPPNGLAVVPKKNQLWTGNAGSIVSIIDLSQREQIATINTSGTSACDEMNYSPEHNVVIVANPDDDPPFLSFINVDTRQIVHRLEVPDATDGIEDPVCFNGYLYQVVPETTTHPGGEVKMIDLNTYETIRVYPIVSCNPKGGAFANDGVTMLLSCGNQVDLYTVLLNTETGGVTTLPGVGRGDVVAYDTNSDIFFATGRLDANTPVIGVIEDGEWAQVINTVNLTTTRLSHTIAVDSNTGFVFAPLNAGVGVYVSSSAHTWTWTAPLMFLCGIVVQFVM